MKINEKMKELRTQLHLSQDYVAKYLGVNRSSSENRGAGKRNSWDRRYVDYIYHD